MTRTEIRRAVFQDHKPAEYVGSRLGKLLAMQLARAETVQTGGRSAQRFHAATVGVYVKSVESPPPDRETPPFHAYHVHATPPNNVATPDREVFEL